MLLAIWFIGFAAFFLYLLWIGVKQHKVHEKVYEMAQTAPISTTVRAVMATLTLGVISAFWFIVLPIAMYRDYKRKQAMRRVFSMLPRELQEKLRNAGVEKP